MERIADMALSFAHELVAIARLLFIRTVTTASERHRG